MDVLDALTHHVVARYGDDGEVRAAGVVVAVATEPQYLIRLANGEQVWWAVSLCEVADERRQG